MNWSVSLRTFSLIVYEACILSSIEVWTTYAKHENRLTAFHVRCLRRIIGVTLEDRVTNNQILEQVKTDSIHSMFRLPCLWWLGHVSRIYLVTSLSIPHPVQRIGNRSTLPRRHKLRMFVSRTWKQLILTKSTGRDSHETQWNLSSMLKSTGDSGERKAPIKKSESGPSKTSLHICVRGFLEEEAEVLRCQ